MKKHIIIISIFFFSLQLSAQEKNAYQIFDKEGKQVNYEQMIDAFSEANIILFGEFHDNPISHWMEMEITKSIFKNKEGKITLGAEMFESDNQLVINEYLEGLIKTSKFETDCRLWPNYDTDYKPLVEFAKENQIPFIATNVPRRYASVVFGGGFEALNKLSEEAKKYFPPLPIPYDAELECYKGMMQMTGPMGGSNPNFPKAQAIKDATMAHFILKYYEQGSTFIHYNGAYHSDNYQGIYWYIKQADESLKIKTISTVLQEELNSLSDENIGLADFIIVVPESMTRTY
jgi:uncharacterized iron-regulated protein